MSVIGIDTGAKGGIAWIQDDASLWRAWRTPLLPEGKGIDFDRLGELFKELEGLGRFEWAIERVRAFPTMAPKKNKAGRVTGTHPVVMASTQVMVENYGVYKYLLRQAGVAVAEYEAVSWRSSFRSKSLPASRSKEPDGAKRVTDANKANKLASMRMANSLWPDAAQRFPGVWGDGPGEGGLIALHHQQVTRLQQRQQKLELGR